MCTRCRSISCSKIVRKFPTFLLLVTLGWFCGMAHAELVVIVNPANRIERMTRDDVINIFMGRFRQFGNGVPATPFDLPNASPEKEIFYRLLLGKTVAEVNAYWARLVFSGYARAPAVVATQAEVLEAVANQRGGIAYLPRSQVDHRVRIVFELE